MELNTNLGIVIRQLRTNSNMTQAELAQKSGITWRYLSDIEEAERFDTYLATLKKMGLDKVEDIAVNSVADHNRFDCPFVSKQAFDGIKNSDRFTYVEVDGYYVIKGIMKKHMSNFLKLCAERLGNKITIE